MHQEKYILFGYFIICDYFSFVVFILVNQQDNWTVF